MNARMLVISLFAVVLASCTSVGEPDLTGSWAGTLRIGGGQLRLIFHISEGEDGLETQIESVDQGNQMIPTETTVDGNTVTFEVTSLNVLYVATVEGDRMVGVFTQFGNRMDDYTIVRE